MLDYPLGSPFVDANIPEYCYEHCWDKWDYASNNTAPIEDYDTYPNRLGECSHSGAIEFSHDALQAINDKTRLYVVIDKCSACDEEYGETTFQFACERD